MYSFGFVGEIELDGVFLFINNNHLPDILSILHPFHPQRKDEWIAPLGNVEFQAVFVRHPIDILGNFNFRERIGLKPGIEERP